MLLVHGVPDSSGMWDAVIERLADRFDCIAVDLPGFGRSTWSDGLSFELENMAELLERVCVEAGVDEGVTLVVQDFGTVYGLAWAASHPERLARVVVLNGPFTPEFRYHRLARMLRVRGLGEMLMRFMNRWHFSWEIMRASGAGRSYPEVKRQFETVVSSPYIRGATLAMYRAFDPAELGPWSDRLAALAETVPVRVVWGELDVLVPRRIALTFHTDDVRFLPEVGHWVAIEAPDAVAEAVSEPT